MADSSQTWLGNRVRLTLKDPPDEQVQGIITGVVPQKHLIVDHAYVWGTQAHFPRLEIHPANIKDLEIISAPNEMLPSAITSPVLETPITALPVSTPTPQRMTFQDPAILSLGRASGSGPSSDTPKSSQREKKGTPIITNPADRLTYSSPDETDTTTVVPPHERMSGLSLQSNKDPTALDTTEDDIQGDIASSSVPAAKTKSRRRGNKKGRNGKNNDGVASGTATPTGTSQGKGWRQTPMLQGQATQSFQPFKYAKKSMRTQQNGDGQNGWASEDVTDVQEAGDFDFAEALAKFDKKTVFNEMQKMDEVDESDRLVSHNRLPKPKPGTAGGKNLHYSENVLDLPSASNASARIKETPDDFWKSEADEDTTFVYPHEPDRTSGREDSGRNAHLRAESRTSASRRSQSRKASGAGNAAGPIRVNSGLKGAPSGLHTAHSKRRIDTFTHLQMLVVENVAQNDFGLTEDLMAENAGRSIAEVAMKALDDPAIKLQAAAASPPFTASIAVLVGNHKSGVRAVAAARHLRNRGISVLVCVVGLDRESELLDELRKQLRLFRHFGGSVCTKAGLFDQLSKNTATFSSSSQVSITLIIDALLGLTISFEELRKSDQASTYELMEWANRNEAFVLAIDIPSGMEPSSGKVNVIDGVKLCVRPRYIVALGAPKLGLLKALDTGDTYGDGLNTDEWTIFLGDVGLGPAIWRKTAKVRRGIEFDHGSWTMELRYHPAGEE